MDYQCIENESTGELRISITGELLELSRCGRVMIDIIEGTKSRDLRSRIHSDRLSKITSPVTVSLGDSKKELFSYSKKGLEYCFLPDGHPKAVVDAAKNHYMVMKLELDSLMDSYHGKPGPFNKKFGDVDYYG